jgi:hypothetical protein
MMMMMSPPRLLLQLHQPAATALRGRQTQGRLLLAACLVQAGWQGEGCARGCCLVCFFWIGGCVGQRRIGDMLLARLDGGTRQHKTQSKQSHGNGIDEEMVVFFSNFCTHLAKKAQAIGACHAASVDGKIFFFFFFPSILFVFVDGFFFCVRQRQRQQKQDQGQTKTAMTTN